MKITNIHISNFLGLRSFERSLGPVTLVAGPNGSGKSSLRDAIAFALSGAPAREVTKKKDYGSLVSDGAKKASVVVNVEGETPTVVTLPDGSRSGFKPDNPALSFCLDMHRFAGLTADERRTFLFELSGVSADSDTVRGKLLARGCDETKSARVLPLLRVGFPEANLQSRNEAREAKGAWRGVTGLTWGEKQAEGWEAPVPAYPEIEGGIELLRKRITSLEDSARLTHEKKGGLLARKQRAVATEKRVSELRSVAGGYAKIAEELEAEKKNFEEQSEKLRSVTEEIQYAQSGRQEHYWECPHCSKPVRIEDGKLVAYSVPAISDPTGKEALFELRTAKNGIEKSLESVRARIKARDLRLAEADRAAKALAELEDHPVEPVSLDDIAKVDAEIKETQEKIFSLRDIEKAWEKAEDGRLSASRKTKEAVAYHGDVLAWLAIAEALSPSGIPSELLLDAMAPVNAALDTNSKASSWPRVVIHEDMGISYGGRPYGLLSESERWRCDAMLAAAVAELSGLNVLVLDRLDVLDLRGRGQAMTWLYGLRNRFDTVIAMATLKQPPAEREGLSVVWLGDGDGAMEKAA